MPAIWVLSPDRACYMLGVKTWLSTLEIVYLCVFQMIHIVKAVGPFYLVSMPGEVKYPTKGANV